MRKRTLLQVARRRWGSARVVPGGLARPRATRTRRRKKAPGTAAERQLVHRLVGRTLNHEEMTDAIRLLRAGAKLKELEINERLESLFDD